MTIQFWLATAVLAVAAPMQANAQLSAQVLPERSTFEEVFAASHKFYPGQRLQIRIDGQVDANHRYWRDRECSWFGLKCKWVDREASNFMAVDRLPLLLSLEPTTALSKPEFTNQPKWYGNAGAQHLPVAPNGVYDFTVEVTDADKSVEAFATGVALRGVVADKFDATNPINRGQCHNRPPVCSSGAYKITVSVNNQERVEFLKRLLESRRVSAEILGRRVMDPLFLQDAMAKPEIADALFVHATRFHKEGTDEARREYLAILSFASTQNPTRTDILNEIAATYIALGEFTAASASVKEGLTAAKNKFDSEQPRRASTVVDLAKALGLRAAIWAQERAGMVGTDMMVAVGLYREAAKYCLEEAVNQASAQDKLTLYGCGKDHLIDAGRQLAMLRSRDNLILAERLLSQAQEAARLAVDVSQQ